MIKWIDLNDEVLAAESLLVSKGFGTQGRSRIKSRLSVGGFIVWYAEERGKERGASRIEGGE